MKIPASALAVIERLSANGFEALAVGGCVRDTLLGREPNDWDVTTSSPPDTTLALFAEAGFKAIPTGIAHGTVTVLSQGEPIEVTTYRVDGGYSDGRHPDKVRFTGSLTDDLARRDFTVNSMAYSPLLGLCDPYGGRSDLESKTIRAVGEPERRFGEDALRILRALRFASTLGFSIEPDTSEAVHKLRGLLVKVSRERIAVELIKLLRGVNATAILRDYADVIESAGIAVNLNSADSVGLIHSLCEIRGEKPSDALLLAALTADTASLESLKLDKKTLKRAVTIAESTNLPMLTDADARRLCAKVGIDAAHDTAIFAAKPDFAALIDEVAETNACINPASLKLRGGELKSLGIPPERIGMLMQSLLDAVLENPSINEHETLLELVKGMTT